MPAHDIDTSPSVRAQQTLQDIEHWKESSQQSSMSENINRLEQTQSFDMTSRQLQEPGVKRESKKTSPEPRRESTKNSFTIAGILGEDFEKPRPSETNEAKEAVRLVRGEMNVRKEKVSDAWTGHDRNQIGGQDRDQDPSLKYSCKRPHSLLSDKSRSEIVDFPQQMRRHIRHAASHVMDNGSFSSSSILSVGAHLFRPQESVCVADVSTYWVRQAAVVSSFNNNNNNNNTSREETGQGEVSPLNGGEGGCEGERRHGPSFISGHSRTDHNNRERVSTRNSEDSRNRQRSEIIENSPEGNHRRESVDATGYKTCTKENQRKKNNGDAVMLAIEERYTRLSGSEMDGKYVLREESTSAERKARSFLQQYQSGVCFEIGSVNSLPFPPVPPNPAHLFMNNDSSPTERLQIPLPRYSMLPLQQVQDDAVYLGRGQLDTGGPALSIASRMQLLPPIRGGGPGAADASSGGVTERSSRMTSHQLPPPLHSLGTLRSDPHLASLGGGASHFPTHQLPPPSSSLLSPYETTPHGFQALQSPYLHSLQVHHPFHNLPFSTVPANSAMTSCTPMTSLTRPDLSFFSRHHQSAGFLQNG